MASYELVCEACGHAFEIHSRGFLTGDDKVCPVCGSDEVRQKFSSFLRNLGGGSSSGCATPPGSPFG